MDESNRNMAYVQQKFNDLNIESNLPVHVSMNLLKIHVISKGRTKNNLWIGRIFL